MGSLDDRIVIVTGAGTGIGREHALLMAAEGAKVVVNDLGGTVDGVGQDASAAQAVVGEITDAGGTAVANGEDVADFDGARRLIQAAVEAFGGLDVLVNNAGILRDRTLTSMSADEWDAVIRVHLRGHFGPLHWAGLYFKAESAAGRGRKAAVINTSSTSGLEGNFGQANYGAAKAGIASMTIIASMEMAKFGVRVNAIAPAARTRMTESVPGLGEALRATDGEFDQYAPGNVSPLVAYLATEGAPENGRVYLVHGGYVGLFQPWHVIKSLDNGARWSVTELAEHMKSLDIPLAPAY